MLILTRARTWIEQALSFILSCVFAKQEQFTLSSWHHTDSNIFLYFSRIVSFGLHSLWVQPKFSWSRNDVGSSISSFLSISPTWEPFSASFPPFLMASTLLTEITLVSDERTYTPNSEFSPIQVLMMPVRIISPKAIRLMHDRTHFAQEVPRDLQFYPHDFGLLCRGRRIPNIWTFRFGEFWAIWEHPPILPGCRQILHQLLVHRNLVILK